MSLSSSHDRYQSTYTAFSTYYQQLRDDGVGAQNALRSVFTTACLSPDVMGVGL